MALTKVRGDGVQGMSLLSTSAAFAIDTNGVITTTSIPAFLARYNGAATNLDTETWVFNSTSINDGYNNGGHYSTSNGRFTAPVAGRYNIHFSTIVNTQATNMTMQLQKNGSTLDQMHLSQDEGGWNTYRVFSWIKFRRKLWQKLKLQYQIHNSNVLNIVVTQFKNGVITQFIIVLELHKKK